MRGQCCFKLHRKFLATAGAVESLVVAKGMKTTSTCAGFAIVVVSGECDCPDEALLAAADELRAVGVTVGPCRLELQTQHRWRRS